MNANRKANQKHMQDMLARMDANRKWNKICWQGWRRR
jgi:hypothetical protein